MKKSKKSSSSSSSSQSKSNSPSPRNKEESIEAKKLEDPEERVFTQDLL